MVAIAPLERMNYLPGCFGMRFTGERSAAVSRHVTVDAPPVNTLLLLKR